MVLVSSTQSLSLAYSHIPIISLCPQVSALLGKQIPLLFLSYFFYLPVINQFQAVAPPRRLYILEDNRLLQDNSIGMMCQNGDYCIGEKCDRLAKVYIFILCDNYTKSQLQVILCEMRCYLQETCQYTSKLSVSNLQLYLICV